MIPAPPGKERVGNWLFRYRSYLPPLLLGVLGAALFQRRGRTHLGLDPHMAQIGLLVAAVGLMVRAAVVGTAPRGTSGRNTKEQVAEQLNTTGLYSVVRHPLYLGNLLLWLGPAIAVGGWWPAGVIAVAFAAFYRPIIAAEEAFLERRFGADYQKWAQTTPALLPNPSRWRRPALPYSWKTVLRQEYYGVFTVVAFFVALEATAQRINTGSFGVSRFWLGLLAAVTVITGTLRFFQRYTTILNVPGR